MLKERASNILQLLYTAIYLYKHIHIYIYLYNISREREREREREGERGSFPSGMRSCSTLCSPHTVLDDLRTCCILLWFYDKTVLRCCILRYTQIPEDVVHLLQSTKEMNTVFRHLAAGSLTKRRCSQFAKVTSQANRVDETAAFVLCLKSSTQNPMHTLSENPDPSPYRACDTRARVVIGFDTTELLSNLIKGSTGPRPRGSL